MSALQLRACVDRQQVMHATTLALQAHAQFFILRPNAWRSKLHSIRYGAFLVN